MSSEAIEHSKDRLKLVDSSSGILKFSRLVLITANSSLGPRQSDAAGGSLFKFAFYESQSGDF
jgi:hypothetical protein